MRIFIADDEIPVVQWIKFCIERSGGDYQIVGDASNGEDAFSGILASNADIAIIDIMMPKTNGLELLVRLKEHAPQVSVFMLTNFSDFKYIQQALRMGADEYYLKSEITEETLISTLKRISERRFHKNYPSAMPEDYSVIRRLCRDIFNQTITGKADFEKALKVHLVKDNLFSSLFVVAIRNQKDCGAFSGDPVINPHIPFVTGMYHVTCGLNISLIICEIKNVNSRLTIYNNINGIVGWLKGVFPVFYGGISNIYYKTADLFNAILEAKDAMNYCFYGEEGAIRHIWDVAEKPINFSKLTKYESEIMQRLKSGSYKLNDVIGDIFQYFRYTTPVNINIVYDYFTGIIHTIGGYCLKQENNPGFDYLEVRNSMIQAICECELLDWLQELILDNLLGTLTADHDSSKYSPVIRNVINYLENHYNEQISLQSIAEHFFLNADYLGRLFKKEVKVSFNTFLTHIRMRYAEELMRTSGLKKYEIAEKVGYTNFSYFSRVYNKYKKHRDKFR